MRPFANWTALIQIAPALAAMLAAASQPASAQEKKITLQESDLPRVIRKAIKEAFPRGVILRIEQEVEGEDVGQFDLEIRIGKKELEVEISKQGKVIESKEKSGQTQPAAEGAAKGRSARDSMEWTSQFDLSECDFATSGANRFFILRPGYRLVLASDEEKVEITVLNETEKIGDVETRVVEEREYANGQLKEVSRNFFAICEKTGNVFYFGEDVDEYANGKVVKHSVRGGPTARIPGPA